MGWWPSSSWSSKKLLKKGSQYMAGIAGTASRDDNALKLMLDRLRHRGHQSTWRHGAAALGCCELPAEAGSPGRTHCQAADRVAVIDGHLYAEEEPLLHEAELLLSLYERFGSGFAERLDGDFACAVAAEGELLLARDPVGLRPLFYGHKDGDLYFASEAKALLDVCTEVVELPPGHIYTPRDGLQPYTSRQDPVPEFGSAEEAARILADLVRGAVQRRMRDGLPGGVLLSGGLDSSIIACLAKESRPDLKTFTVGVGEAGSEDLKRAREMARYLGTEHHEYIYGEREIEQVLPQVIYHLESFEEDCVFGAVANYFAATLAAQHTVCVLCGEGADEFLGGYHELKEARSEVEFLDITEDLIGNAYHTGLQRLERMMAAQSLEFRTAFLDSRVTAFCRTIPPAWKVYGEEKVEKWILRQAFSSLLPESILHRVKQPFAVGAGSAGFTKSIGQRAVSGKDYLGSREADSGMTLKSKAEFHYYRIFKEQFPAPSFSRLVTRWDPLSRRQQ